MRGISFRTIFIMLVLILIGIGVFRNFEKKKKETLVATEYVPGKDSVISKDLRIGIIEFDNINPILSNNKNVQDISRLIFDPLFTLTQDYKLQPALATEYSEMDDNTYLIKLRENVKWQDGSKFDSNDVIFTIDILKNLGESSIYYHNIKDISKIEKLDNSTIRITTDGDIPYYEYNFIFPIMSSKYFNSENFTFESKNINPIGTGKFYISDVKDGSIVLRKNISNWESNVIQLDTITLKLYNSLTNVIDAFKAENIDMFATSNLNIKDYLNNNQYIEKNYINRNYYYMALNTNNKILENIEVRQAINSAINKEQIVEEVFNGKYKISNFPIDFGSYAYNTANEHMSFDENTAKNLLLDGGWKFTSKKWRKIVNYRYVNIEFTIVAKKSDRNSVKIAEQIKAQLEKIGMIIRIEEASDSKYQSYLNNKNYDLIIVNSNYSYGPTINKYFKEDNLSNYSNDEIVELLDRANDTNEEDELKETISKINEIYNNDVPYVSLCYSTNNLIYSTSLKGEVNPNSYNLFYRVNTWYREYKK